MNSLKPKKHLGQHFLIDENTARNILDLLNAPSDATVIEIGPGMGVLTKYLVEKYKNVIAVEFDPHAVEYLKTKFADTNLVIHHADFLKWPFSKHLPGPAYFIGNLPYNVSSPIFFRLLEQKSYVKQGVFMVQKEVAERVCASEDATPKIKGILSVLVSRYFRARLVFRVRPSVFRPPPRVMSGVLVLERQDEKEEPEFNVLRKLVKAAFGKRRKTLRNALREFEINWEQFPQQWPTLRAEALPFDAYNQLADSLYADDHAS